jgi:hypothetical protein
MGNPGNPGDFYKVVQYFYSDDSFNNTPVSFTVGNFVLLSSGNTGQKLFIYFGSQNGTTGYDFSYSFVCDFDLITPTKGPTGLAGNIQGLTGNTGFMGGTGLKGSTGD